MANNVKQLFNVCFPSINLFSEISYLLYFEANRHKDGLAWSHTSIKRQDKDQNPSCASSGLLFFPGLHADGPECLCVCSHSLCPTCRDPMDCSPPGSSVHGIFQARILEWVAISFSRGIFPTQESNPCLLNCQADSLPLSHQGSLMSDISL